MKKTKEPQEDYEKSSDEAEAQRKAQKATDGVTPIQAKAGKMTLNVVEPPC